MPENVNIFERYGIKEVANVSLFALSDDDVNGYKEGDVVLYLDTLKVSTTETTAEQVDARGGEKPPAALKNFLNCWDTLKFNLLQQWRVSADVNV